MSSEISRAPRYVDIRDESEYISDLPKQSDIEEVRQRYAFTREFLAQELSCSHCGLLYRPRDNFGKFGCRMHCGTLETSDNGNFYYSCCGEDTYTAAMTVGCVPCIHSFRAQDFNDIVMTQVGYKNLPIDLVDILKPFPIDKNMIVAVNHRDGKYMFATSQAQLLRVRALSHPGRPIPGTIYEHDEDLDEYGADDDPVDHEDEEQMMDDWSSSIRVASDNWKIKMFLH